MCVCVCACVCMCVCVRMGGWTDKCMDGYVDECTGG